MSPSSRPCPRLDTHQRSVRGVCRHAAGGWLTTGDVVIRENLAAHTRATARELVEVARCRLHFLPAYSPDFNPIEGAMSKLKTHLRRSGARTNPALITAIADALNAITTHDTYGWFHGCGYIVVR